MTLTPTPLFSHAIARQSDPSPGLDIDIAELVKSDIEDRARMGETKYGRRLTPNNGRDSLIDAYQEALDLAMYIRQAIEERHMIEDDGK